VFEPKAQLQRPGLLLMEELDWQIVEATLSFPRAPGLEPQRSSRRRRAL